MTMHMALAPKIRSVELPKELREIKAWLIWRYEQFEGETKPRKIPYWFDGTRRHGKQGGPVDRERLTVFGVAREFAVRLGYDGVGFAPLDGCGYTFLDFDNCVGPDGSLPPEIEQIAARTYAEYSPSGKGVRIALKGNLGNRKSISTPDQYGFETFSTSGYVTFTGNILDICDLTVGPNHIAEVDDHVRNLCEKRFGCAQPEADVDPDDFMIGHEPRLGLSVERMEELVNQLDPDMGREPWIKVGMALHHECDGDDTGFEIWDDWSSGGATYPGTEGLRKDWDSFERRSGQRRRQVTFATIMWMVKERQKGTTILDADELRNLVDGDLGKLPQSNGVCTPEGFAGKFPVYAAGDPQLHKNGEWFVKSVIPKADIIVLYGASGSGKSFIAYDIAAAIARGVPWQSHRVHKAKVVIIAAEGAGGVGKRFQAYCKHHGISLNDLDLGIINVPPDLIKEGDVAELAKSLMIVGAELLVIDTFAQVTPGANENSSEDMGRALANIRILSEVTGATALVVHHAGKDATRGARGWSGIKAAADAELEVTRTDDRGLLKITKMKDGDDGLVWGFRLQPIDLGFDDDGDTETSCVVEYLPAPIQKQRRNEPKGAIQRNIMVRARICGASTSEGALTKDVVDACIELIPFDTQPACNKKRPRDQRRGSVMRALTKLCEQGFLTNIEERLYLPSVGKN